MLGNGRGGPGLKRSWRTTAGLFGVALCMAAACGKSEEEPPSGQGYTPPKGGTGSGTGGSRTGGTGGMSGKGGASGEGGEAPTDPLAPTVEITSPDAVDDPNDGSVLIDSEVEVVCEATQSTEDGSEPVDSGRVLIEVLDADGMPIDDLSKPGDETEDGVFTASFVLTQVPTGQVSFRCSVSDQTDPGHVGIDTISTFVDHGPTIHVTSPLEDSAYSLVGAVPFRFTVTPTPLVADDPGAEVGDVTLTVLGKNIPVTMRAGGEYRASVNFNDSVEWPDTPKDVHVNIEATNVREPEAATGVVDYGFKIDSTGPVITVIEPDKNKVVGGEVILRFSAVDDISGVDETTVWVSINGGDRIYFDPMGPWSRIDDTFAYRFDTTSLTTSVIQASFNIGCQDKAHNESDGESLLLYLDNVPPFVDLDPPMVREKVASGNLYQCSVAFDPLGVAASDRQNVSVIQRFRTLVWDRTNTHPSATDFHYSGTDPESVYMYVQPDPNAGLLIDTDGDHVCDDVDKRLTFDHQHGLKPEGNAFFGSATDEPMGAPTFPDGPGQPCEGGYRGDTQRPAALCTPPSSDLTRTVAWDFDQMVPVVYATGDFTQPYCTGVGFEIGNIKGIKDGWVCLAARAVDNAGNVGVSRPLRVCFDDGVGAPANCSATPPTCATDCTVSTANDFPSDVILIRR